METKKQFKDNPVNGAEDRVKELGYKQELKRGLSVPQNVVMGLANVSPVMAAFTYALAAFATVGTATAGGTLLQCINVLCIGLILGELGSVYPVSGGLYSITRYVLPKPLVFLGVFNFMIQAFKNMLNQLITFRVSSKIQTTFTDHHCPQHIDQIMLFGKLCGCTDKHCKYTGKHAIPFWNLIITANCRKAKPTYKTMN